MWPKHSIIILSIVVALVLSSLHIAWAQTELHCPDFEFQPHQVASLPGTIIYQNLEHLREDGASFSIISGETLQSTSFWFPEQHYRGLSPDGQWILTSKRSQPWEAGSGVDYELWLHHVGREQPSILLITAPPRTLHAHWLNNERIMLLWRSSRYETADGQIIYPFEDPVVFTPLPLQWDRIDDWIIVSYSPDLRRALLFHEEQFEYGIFDTASETIMPLPDTVDPEPLSYAGPLAWLPDGRLSYVLPIEHDPEEYKYYGELYITDFTSDTPTQISNFADEFGNVQVDFPMIWSPDGRKLAFRMGLFDKPREERRALLENTAFPMNTSRPHAALYVLDITTGTTTPLCVIPDDSGNAPHFFWSPDSQYLAFIYDDNLVVLNVETQVFSSIDENATEVFDWK